MTNFGGEAVSPHEAGHGLGQSPSGKLYHTDNGGKLHLAPRAVINAGYAGVHQSLADSDNGGHCSNWANWPNNPSWIGRHWRSES